MNSALFVLFLVVGVARGALQGLTTRYWDCCKPSCAWNGKAKTSHPVETCSADGHTAVNVDTTSGCGGGGLPGKAYTCNSNQPWVISDELSFGFAAAFVVGHNEASLCCTCWELTFTNTAAKGKKFVVQVTNTGDDPGLDKTQNHWDLMMPGGGVGLFNGCSSQWNASTDGWGARYGGVASDAECSKLPTPLQPGCHWHWSWFKGADNPNVDMVQVQCPKSILAKSKCKRDDESTVANAHYANM